MWGEQKSDLATMERYEIIEELGQGGFGRVVKAFDQKLKINVAIKFLHNISLLDELTATRFKDEGKAASMVRGVGLVPLLDSGVDEKGVPYLVHRYCPNGTLAHHIDAGQRLVGPKLFERLVKPLLIGIQTIHEAGIIHRDIKPENLYATDEDNYALGDFGLARFKGRLAKTATGLVVGTPLYLPPEAWATDSSAYGKNGDIYAAGLVIVEACTGRLPHDGVPHSKRVLTIVSKGIKCQDLQDIGVSAQLARVLTPMLVSNPEERPADTKELLERFEQTIFRLRKDEKTLKAGSSQSTKHSLTIGQKSVQMKTSNKTVQLSATEANTALGHSEKSGKKPYLFGVFVVFLAFGIVGQWGYIKSRFWGQETNKNVSAKSSDPALPKNLNLLLSELKVVEGEKAVEKLRHLHELAAEQDSSELSKRELWLAILKIAPTESAWLRHILRAEAAVSLGNPKEANKQYVLALKSNEEIASWLLWHRLTLQKLGERKERQLLFQSGAQLMSVADRHALFRARRLFLALWAGKVLYACRYGTSDSILMLCKAFELGLQIAEDNLRREFCFKAKLKELAKEIDNVLPGKPSTSPKCSQELMSMSARWRRGKFKEHFQNYWKAKDHVLVTLKKLASNEIVGQRFLAIMKSNKPAEVVQSDQFIALLLYCEALTLQGMSEFEKYLIPSRIAFDSQELLERFHKESDTGQLLETLFQKPSVHYKRAIARVRLMASELSDKEKSPVELEGRIRLENEYLYCAKTWLRRRHLLRKYEQNRWRSALSNKLRKDLFIHFIVSVLGNNADGTLSFSQQQIAMCEQAIVSRLQQVGVAKDEIGNSFDLRLLEHIQLLSRENYRNLRKLGYFAECVRLCQTFMKELNKAKARIQNSKDVFTDCKVNELTTQYAIVVADSMLATGKKFGRISGDVKAILMASSHDKMIHKELQGFCKDLLEGKRIPDSKP